MKATQLNIIEEKHLLRLEKDSSRCANFSLYGNSNQTNDTTYFASVMCGNKCCFVCNYARQKRLRRKYFAWFKENPTLLEISKGERLKYVTRLRFPTWEAKGYNILRPVGYDIMHLTLTVPHYKETGFNGDHYFFQTLADLFHNMRNEVPEWNKLIYGGEYGIETTKSENGLHIHIHSLLFVKQTSQNRNKVHMMILKEWNRRTVNHESKRIFIDVPTMKKIQLSNSMLKPCNVLELHPGGSTMINLETIYSYKEGEKVRTIDFNSKDMLYSIMEAIKYHFEPLAFDKAEKQFDFELLTEIMPRIYKKQLYKKFGCLHGEKALNLKEDNTTIDDFEDSMLINEETGEIRPEYDFFVLNPVFVYHDPAKDNKLYLNREGKRRKMNIEAGTVSSAVSQLGDMVKAQFNNNNNYKS